MIRGRLEICENQQMAAALPANTVERIDALLPQTQCTRCGYPACRAYAEAIAAGEADLNQCPPGGKAGIVALAALLGRAPKPLNPANGVEKPREVAVIDEAACIGCTKCIQACPVDAIVGASKWMHTILVDECTGCDLCIPPCPVDCIAMQPAGRAWSREDARAADERKAARNLRLARAGAAAATPASPDEERARRRAAIDAALGRARARRAALGSPRT